MPHTPGPWDVENEAGVDVVADLATGETVAEVPEGPNQTANAKLIAAAPDLLAAVEGLLSVIASLEAGKQDWFHYKLEIEDAEVALTKAKDADEGPEVVE